MTSDEFLRHLQKQAPAPAYLFLGPEPWDRERCRKALIERALPPEDRADGFTRYDLDDSDFRTVMDDAQSMSLFASNRLIWVGAAESVLPRVMRASADDDDSDGPKEGAAGMLARYLKNPTPGVTLVFDSSRFGFEGEEKAKLQRVQKFYAAIPHQVEFQRYTPAAARKVARAAATQQKLSIGDAEIDLLIEVLDSDVARVVTELEKLALFLGQTRAVTADDIVSLVPNARASTIFALVGALGRNDREASLDSLDILVREGEYLPMALTFLGTQFRLALVAKESGLTNAAQIQAYFSKQGTPMWRARAEQVQQTVAAFSVPKLRLAIQKVYETDVAMRDTRPDDRTVMEQFVLTLL